MRWINFSVPGAASAYGILEDDRIREVRGTPFGGHETTNRSHRSKNTDTFKPMGRGSRPT
jgi:hypothetical protein